MLCYVCWAKFEAALSEAVDVVTHLRSITKGASSDAPGKTQFGPSVIVPQTWQAADDIRVAIAMVAGAPAHPIPSSATLEQVARDVSLLVESINPEQVVARQEGAEAAVRFYRQVQTSMHLQQRSERERHVRWVRCRGCGLESLLMRPPLEHLDDLSVVCTNRACGAVWDPSLAAFDMRVLAETISAEFAERGERIAKEAAAVLKELDKPADDVVPVCMEHAWGDVFTVNGPHEVEVCSVCGEETESGMYRRAAA